MLSWIIRKWNIHITVDRDIFVHDRDCKISSSRLALAQGDRWRKEKTAEIVLLARCLPRLNKKTFSRSHCIFQHFSRTFIAYIKGTAILCWIFNRLNLAYYNENEEFTVESRYVLKLESISYKIGKNGFVIFQWFYKIFLININYNSLIKKCISKEKLIKEKIK